MDGAAEVGAAAPGEGDEAAEEERLEEGNRRRAAGAECLGKSMLGRGAVESI